MLLNIAAMSPDDDLHWYAVYTAPRAEKKVSERFRQDSIEHYLPLHTVKRKWSDRVKEVEVPVVNGYIFVNIAKSQFKEVLNTYGALSFVREFGTPVIIPDQQIQRLRFMIECSDETVEICTETILPGEVIEVVKGPLQGLIGELVTLKGKHKVIIRLEKFGCAKTEVPLSFLQKI